MCIWALVPLAVFLPLTCQAGLSERADHETRKRLKKRGVKVKGDEVLPDKHIHEYYHAYGTPVKTDRQLEREHHIHHHHGREPPQTEEEKRKLQEYAESRVHSKSGDKHAHHHVFHPPTDALAQSTHYHGEHAHHAHGSHEKAAPTTSAPSAPALTTAPEPVHSTATAEPATRE